MFHFSGKSINFVIGKNKSPMMEKELIDFFKITSNNVKPKKGRVLIADPFDSDFFFTRSVVLLTEYSPELGSMGFILNKPLEKDKFPEEIFEEFGEFNLPRIYYGGPVERNKMFYIHTLPPTVLPNSMEIMPNLYWGGDFRQLVDFIKDGTLSLDNVKFFIGYSGWSPGQLENEIYNNFWVIDDTTPEEVLGDTTDLWRRKLKALGPKYELWTRYPADPIVN